MLKVRGPSNSSLSNVRNWDIMYLRCQESAYIATKCLNKRTMIIIDGEHIVIDEEDGSNKEMLQNEELCATTRGINLMVMRTIGT